MTPQELRYSVYHLAFQGKLVPQDRTESIIDESAFLVEDEPYDVPDTWKWNNIGKCCEMYSGNSISESEKKLNTKDCKKDMTISVQKMCLLNTLLLIITVLESHIKPILRLPIKMPF